MTLAFANENDMNYTNEQNTDIQTEIENYDMSQHEIVFYDMNNPNQNGEENTDMQTEIENYVMSQHEIVFYDMNNPNQDKENNTKANIKATYYSNVLTNIQQGTQFKIILKTPNIDSSGSIIDLDGIPLANKNVIFTVNGMSYTRTTDSNGMAKLNINLDPGQYIISYKFMGDSQYDSSNDKIEINVFSGNTYMLYLEDKIYRTEQFGVALFDANENRLANKNIIFTVNGMSYTRTTDSNGIAKLNINLNPGQYPISYTFSGSGNYQSCSGNTILSVSMKNIIVTPINTNLKRHTSFQVKFTDEKGNPVRNQVVYFKINNVPYNRTTDSRGIASLTINLLSGQYIIDVGFNSIGNNMYYTFTPVQYTLNVFDSNNNQYHITSLGNYIIQGNTYKVRLTDSNNNVLTNKNVYFCINSVPYTRQTNAYGIASITINLNANNYMISASYGTSTSQISNIEMINVATSGVMNNAYSTTDYNKSTYILTHSDYECLNNTYIQSLANSITNGITDELEKAVLIHNYVYRLNYKFNNNGLNNAYNVALLNQANCYDQTNLLMALAKYSGLAVRGITGISSFNSSIGHAWAQFLINNEWIVSDPTNTEILGSWSANYGGYYYTNYKYCVAFEKEIYRLK